jgi:hypothetical protein
MSMTAIDSVRELLQDTTDCELHITEREDTYIAIHTNSLQEYEQRYIRTTLEDHEFDVYSVQKGGHRRKFLVI